MGFFIREAIFYKKNNKISVYLSLFFPICLHGFYNHLIFSPNFSSFWIYFLLIAMFIRSIFIFRKERKLQLNSINENAHVKYYKIMNGDIYLTIFSSLVILMIITLLIKSF